MNIFLRSITLAVGLTVSALAQAAPTPATASTPTVTAVCKDGTPFSGTTLNGACRGHGGVDKNAPAAPASKAQPSTAAAPAAKSAAPAKTDSGNASGQVWVNTGTKVYHCQGDRYYGKTKTGEYMSEADAKAKGFHADHGKACTK